MRAPTEGSQKTESSSVGRRPNTLAPTTVISLTSENLLSMSDEELRSFADDYLGILIEPNTSRTKIEQRIVNAAFAVRDGL